MKLLVGNPHGDGIVKVFDTDTGEVTVLSDGNIGGTHGELTTAVETLKEAAGANDQEFQQKAKRTAALLEGNPIISEILGPHGVIAIF
jgi:hypothetical protein